MPADVIASQVNNAGGPLRAASGILHARAGLRPFALQIKQAGGVKAFLAVHFGHTELVVPFYQGGRPFWRKRTADTGNKSGALGRLVAQTDGAVTSAHPSNRFAGFGERVVDVLRRHDEATSCFYPMDELAQRHDFSMLLLGCVDESPGFTTVHAAQHRLGLTRKHLERFLLRWDCHRGQEIQSIVARESPGCSVSFGKFYPAYERDNNLVRGVLFGAPYLFVPSARRAIEAELAILRRTPRIADCGRLTCTTCRLRFY